jgi:hypothetical protein
MKDGLRYAADEATEVLLKRFEGNPDVGKARVESDRAQKVEERSHKDFDGLDFSSWQAATSAALVLKLVKPKGTRVAAHAFLRHFVFLVHRAKAGRPVGIRADLPSIALAD